MTFLLVSSALAFAALIAGSISDLKTREVPDWVNYGLFSAAIALRLIFAVLQQDWGYLAEGMFGFAVMIVVALLAFYSGQMGGGDAKLLMAMGMLLGLPFSWIAGISGILVAFLFNSLIMGALYGMCWSSALALRHWKNVRKVFMERFRQPKIRIVRKLGLLCCVGLIVLAFVLPPPLQVLVFFLIAIYLIILYTYLFVQAVEQVCMIKSLPVRKLTVGDWIAKPVQVRGKIILKPTPLGLSPEQLRMLQTKKNIKVVVKQGVPFVPSFLLAYLATLLWGNLLFLMFAW